MRIAHFAPFAPHRCGLYETARDMARAEALAGHEPVLVDTGVEGARQRTGADERLGYTLEVVDYEQVVDCDLLVVHSNVPDSFVRATQAPIVQILHGRPHNSFLLSRSDPKAPVYQILAARTQDPRWRAFVTLWSEYVPYWRVLIPSEKLYSTPDPPCDLEQYATGERYDFGPGRHVLVADMPREDVDTYEVVHGLMSLASAGRVRVHLYAMQNPLGPWEYILGHLRHLGLLGEVKGIMHNFDRVLRGADVVVTPHIIATRIVREALACGTPVVGPCQNRYACARYSEVGAAGAAVSHLWAWPGSGANVAGVAQRFALDRFMLALDPIYQQALA